MNMDFDAQQLLDQMMNGQQFLPDFCGYNFVLLDEQVEDIMLKTGDDFFRNCFGLEKLMVRCLIMELHKRTYDQNENGLCFDMSVLVTLSYLMGNMDLLLQIEEFQSYYSSATVKRCVKSICQTIVYFLSPSYVRFPRSQKELESNKEEFLSKFGISGVVGVLDCHHVRLLNVPKYEEDLYLNKYSQGPTLTVQLISDKNHRFLDVNARFSGSTHASYIWDRSHINSMLKNFQKQDSFAWLLADRKYRSNECLVIPYRKPVDKLQESVNFAMKETLYGGLKSFAILKARFRCLDTALPFDHANACNVITACVTLHNFLMEKGQNVEHNLAYNVMKETHFRNSSYPEELSPKAMENRKFIGNFMCNNSIQILYKIRKETNLSFVGAPPIIAPPPMINTYEMAY
uniref:DDE Tnp4 domain-containing protein n=1 Tax=Stomoxys calcitrans TaxID=35570 RepID=A0A1I8NLA9_STOCA